MLAYARDAATVADDGIDQVRELICARRRNERERKETRKGGGQGRTRVSRNGSCLWVPGRAAGEGGVERELAFGVLDLMDRARVKPDITTFNRH
eukprot:1633403-Rhodomonas_salina.2